MDANQNRPTAASSRFCIDKPSSSQTGGAAAKLVPGDWPSAPTTCTLGPWVRRSHWPRPKLCCEALVCARPWTSTIPMAGDPGEGSPPTLPAGERLQGCSQHQPPPSQQIPVRPHQQGGRWKVVSWSCETSCLPAPLINPTTKGCRTNSVCGFKPASHRTETQPTSPTTTSATLGIHKGRLQTDALSAKCILVYHRLLISRYTVGKIQFNVTGRFQCNFISSKSI